MNIKRETRSQKKIRQLFNDILDKKKDRKTGIEFAMKLGGDWNRGYTMAMNAILNLQKTKSFSLRLDFDTSLEDISFFHRRFKKLCRDGFLREIDHGYFASWRDYLSYLSSKKISKKEDID